jgi:glycosyltransferase involved in cell wall biosynthesis
MNIELLYCSYNRREFARQNLASLKANTNWDLVSRVVVYEDGSTDGTAALVSAWASELPVAVEVKDTRLGGPIAIMNHYLRHAAPVFCKMDSDVIVPPGWLDACVTVMDAEPTLDLLGIEPPLSRAPSIRRAMKGAKFPDPRPEQTPGPLRSVPCPTIGGIGLMRAAAFEGHTLTPYAVYGGFTTWQTAHARVRKGWIAPALKLFLLDRLIEEPWISLSHQYMQQGWQRDWTRYDPKDKDALWGWWTPVAV